MVRDGLLTFPQGFMWGAATSAAQVEGAVDEGGRSPSIWDTFAEAPNRIVDGATPRRACDHYHRYRDDVALMVEVGLSAYRFSISWTRVMPDGGTLEPRGLDFYDRLVDELLDRSIEPVATLYHWDLPQTLQDNGGWLNRDTALRFAEYSAQVHSALADRVNYWSTLNEPLVASFLGYGSGAHAPGGTNHADALGAAHHMLVAHGLTVAALRTQARPNDKLSIVLNFSPCLVDVDTPEYHEAARKFDGLHNRWFLDPVMGLGYPKDILADAAHLRAMDPVLKDGDLEIIAGPLDWLGVNYYAPTRMAPKPDTTAVSNCPLPGLRGADVLPAREPLTSFGWEQTPASLTDLLGWLSWRHPEVPLVVAENGAAFDDVLTDGRVHDVERVRYLTEHLCAVHKAIEGGADVRGYFAWSLLDNFEWAMGYSQRFGIVHVDFDSMIRTIKDSGRLLSRIAKANAVPRSTGAIRTTGAPISSGALTRLS